MRLGASAGGFNFIQPGFEPPLNEVKFKLYEKLVSKVAHSFTYEERRENC